jgi:hypothetical protein
MKKYLILFAFLILATGVYFISGFAFSGSDNQTGILNIIPEDTIKQQNSGVSPEVISPEEVKPGQKDSKCSNCSCKCKHKCKQKCGDTDTTVHTGNNEIPVGENPYLNNPDTAKNKITPQEEK